MDTRAYWVGFNLVKGIGAVRLRGLLDFFGNLETAWDAPGDALMAAGLTPKLIEGLGRVKAKNLIERAWNYIERLGIEVLTWEDPAYPSRLKQIDQPPPVLHTRGDFLLQVIWRSLLSVHGESPPMGDKPPRRLLLFWPITASRW